MRTVRFDSIRWSMDSEGAWLSLRVSDREQAVAACEEVQAGKKYVAEIKQHREKRSLDANAYFHVLVNKIAEKQNLGDTEVKRALVLEYGALARDEDGKTLGAMLPVSADVQDFYPYAKWYQEKELDGRKYNCYLFYKQTHTLDSAEMSRLIEGTVLVAKSMGIETMTPAEIARLEGMWKCQN
jgi:hypothetical protein